MALSPLAKEVVDIERILHTTAVDGKINEVMFFDQVRRAAIAIGHKRASAQHGERKV